jgi:hypothetical protein
MNYPNSLRDKYVAEILRRQLSDGSWNQSGGISENTKNHAGDPDVTGMALQALSKYQKKPAVKAATDKALSFLSKAQNANGGYTSWGYDNIESAAQVLIALCELGIPVDDARFVKNGYMLVDNILSFKNNDGSYMHIGDGSGDSQMSAEQALCSLAAAKRAAEGRNSLFRMDDTARRGEFAPLPAAEPGLAGKSPDVTAMPVINPGKTFPDIKNHSNQPAIEALAERGIINGKSKTSFDPDSTMTRAEFAAIVTRGLGLPEKTVLPFTDVSASSWCAIPIAVAYHYEIVAGTSATAFNPDGTITLQEAAVMAARAAKLCGMDTKRTETEIRNALAQFGDYHIVANWAQSSMAFCFSEGILDENEFDFDIEPSKTVKRCEIAEMMYRLLEKANLL